MEEGRSAFKILTGTPTGKIYLGRPRHRWEDNIRMDFKEIGINTRNWVYSSQDRDYCLCECGIEPPDSISHGVSLCISRLVLSRHLFSLQYVGVVCDTFQPGNPPT